MSMALFFIHGTCFAQAPHELGGFVLGKNINEYHDNLQMETSLPIRHMEYIREAEIKDIEGFKSGLIGYGVCHSPGQIVRIKLKYADSTKKFFEKLLKHFKTRFGEPDEWRGDPFHVVMAWKWSFVDKENNRISLILQHNIMDAEEKMGNAVKLTMTNLVEKESLCFKKEHSEFRKGSGKRKHQKMGTTDGVDWDRFIPR
jgi:hypothetical protein